MTVIYFHRNCRKLLVKFKFTGEQIYNLKETIVTTAVQAQHIVAQTGVKQVGQVISVERGQLITICTMINATGNTVTPVFVFPCARMCDALMINAPEASLGLVYCPNKWLDNRSSIFKSVGTHQEKYSL
jgi:hypothetical protein